MMAHANQPLLENQEGQLKSRFWLNYILCMTIKIRNAFEFYPIKVYIFTHGRKTIWHHQSITPNPLCEILATNLFNSDPCNSTCTKCILKWEPFKTNRNHFHCNDIKQKSTKSIKYYHGNYLTCIYINFNTDKKSQSQYICQILHFSAVLYTSERKTDFRLD